MIISDLHILTQQAERLEESEEFIKLHPFPVMQTFKPGTDLSQITVTVSQFISWTLFMWHFSYRSVQHKVIHTVKQ